MKYQVEITYTGTLTFNVDADNEEDAIDVAAVQIKDEDILAACLENEVQTGVIVPYDGFMDDTDRTTTQ